MYRGNGMDRFNQILMYFKLDRDPIYRDGSSNTDVSIIGFRFKDKSNFNS
jgi:hypothetical protein